MRFDETKMLQWKLMVSQAFEKKYLTNLQRKIDTTSLQDMAALGGFNPPNNFPFYSMTKLLIDKRFPIDNLFEYAWAIYECGYDEIQELNPYSQIFLVSIFLYAQRKMERSDGTEEMYYYILAKASLLVEADDRILILEYLEWIESKVSLAYEGFPDDDIFLVLASLIIESSLGTKHIAEKVAKLNHLCTTCKQKGCEIDSIVGEKGSFLSRWIQLVDSAILDKNIVSKITDIMTAP